MNDTKTAPASAARRARVERVTRETTIVVAVNLDGTGRAELATGVPFLDHMLDQVARHGMLDLEIARVQACQWRSSATRTVRSSISISHLRFRISFRDH